MTDPQLEALKARCTTKKRYDTEAIASKVAKRCWWRRKVRLRVYPCFECGGYHLTRRR